MSDKIIFDMKTGIMTINDVYQIKPRMTVEDAKNSNLMEILSPKVGLEFINKKENPDVIFRHFNVGGEAVLVNLDFSPYQNGELDEIEVVVRNFGEESRGEKDLEEFREICRLHDEFLRNMCINKGNWYGMRLRFPQGYIDRIYDNRTPNIKIQITFHTKERMQEDERFNNLSKEEKMKERYESSKRMLEEDKKSLEARKKRWGNQ